MKPGQYTGGIQNTPRVPSEAPDPGESIFRADTDTEERIPTGRRPTSKAAAASLEPIKNNLRNQIFCIILARGGMTCDEVEIALEMRHQSASCLIRFLTQDGFLYEKRQSNGEIEKRQTRSGRNAIVWAARLSPVKEKDPQKELW